VALLGFDARRLCEARKRGVRFDSTLTIGRLNLYLHAGDRRALRRCCPGTGAQEPYGFGDYADAFLRDCLGVRELVVLDRSDYEGATCIHDLNTPIPDDLIERFDAVIEAGSLEHVFNFPVAAANLMNAVKVGGTLFITTPANNLCGHGFYQFSPELMYRAFGARQGFQIRSVRVIEARYPAVESAPAVRVRSVVDPARIGRRVGLRTRRPILLALEATKVARVVPFTETPQQSDYTTRWRCSGAPEPSLGKRLVARLPRPLQSRIQGLFHLWEYSFLNRAVFRRQPEDGPH
jgi:hypothetical protein